MEFQQNAQPAAEANSHGFSLPSFYCPHCKNKIGHPPIWCRFCLRVLDLRVMIECINCGKPILMKSRFCRFCDVTLRCDLSLSSYAAFVTLQAIVKKLTLSRKRNVNDKNSTNPEDDDDDPPPFAGVRRMPLPPPTDEHYVSLDWTRKFKF